MQPNKENRTQQDPVHAGMTGKRQAENLPGSEKATPETEDSKSADDLVQGKKLENKDRGGDTNDADEFVPGS